MDEHDAYFRMLRLLRLLKLDKYVPSITLIDDVVRLKRQPLLLAAGASLALWLLFSSLLWLCEHADTANELDDPLPSYGCIEDCTMADRLDWRRRFCPPREQPRGPDFSRSVGSARGAAHPSTPSSTSLADYP